jgi:hypothetical protein
LTAPSFDAKLKYMTLPELPLLAGAWSAWLLTGLKILGALGFMAAADMVMLYAC